MKYVQIIFEVLLFVAMLGLFLLPEESMTVHLDGYTLGTKKMMRATLDGKPIWVVFDQLHDDLENRTVTIKGQLLHIQGANGRNLIIDHAEIVK